MSVSTSYPRKSGRPTVAVQYAALPYRMNGDTPEILLITSRRTHRWIIPKGWPVEGVGPTICAAREALEEAGVNGRMCKRPIGHFRYLKRLRSGFDLPCRVAVFALKVTDEREVWAENEARLRRWCSIAEAAEAVGEPQLRLVIKRFGARLTAQHKRRNGAKANGQP